ncbi:MAG: ABC transporter permease [Planctomycetota bacterium]
MSAFIVRRLLQAVVTIIGVMIVTFLLFRGIAGDIAAAHLGARATEAQKADWRQKYGYDRPLLLNVHGRLVLTDHSGGAGTFRVTDATGGATIVDAMAFVPVAPDDGATTHQRAGRYRIGLSADDPLTVLTGDTDAAAPPPETPPAMRILPADGEAFEVDLAGVRTVGELITAIESHGDNDGRVTAGIRPWRWTEIHHSQFVDHLVKSVTFQARSLKTNEPLTGIIAERAPKSLAITVPSLAIGWCLAMIIACVVAYYRGTWVDRTGVLLSVLGMCVPYLAFMIYGQWLMFAVAPEHAYGLMHRVNIYVPIAITVVAGLGASVRFYRTVILDEVGRDYVRTARAKGVALPSVLFHHVLRNCMLPILTNLILAIPFLMMGNLLAETYFGIPGLGDLLLSSINGRDEPILNGLVFLTALIYTVGLLLTDLSYAVFDPRIRLK